MMTGKSGGTSLTWRVSGVPGQPEGLGRLVAVGLRRASLRLASHPPLVDRFGSRDDGVWERNGEDGEKREPKWDCLEPKWSEVDGCLLVLRMLRHI